MKPERQQGGLFALILIFIGTIVLLNNFNILPWEVWENLWKFWPVILIIWGLQTLTNKSSLITHLLIMMVTTAIVFLLLSYLNPNFNDYLRGILLRQ